MSIQLHSSCSAPQPSTAPTNSQRTNTVSKLPPTSSPPKKKKNLNTSFRSTNLDINQEDLTEANGSDLRCDVQDRPRGVALWCWSQIRQFAWTVNKPGAFTWYERGNTCTRQRALMTDIAAKASLGESHSRKAKYKVGAALAVNSGREHEDLRASS